jgi:hypothetical protein
VPSTYSAADAGLATDDDFRVPPGRGGLGLEHRRPLGAELPLGKGQVMRPRGQSRESTTCYGPCAATTRARTWGMPEAGARRSRRSAAKVGASERTYARWAGAAQAGQPQHGAQVAACTDLASGALRRTTMMPTWSMSVEPATSPVYDVN